MPRKTAPSDTVQFSITLPSQAIALMKELEATGLYGASRGEVARELILIELRRWTERRPADAKMKG